MRRWLACIVVALGIISCGKESDDQDDPVDGRPAAQKTTSAPQTDLFSLAEEAFLAIPAKDQFETESEYRTRADVQARAALSGQSKWMQSQRITAATRWHYDPDTREVVISVPTVITKDGDEAIVGSDAIMERGTASSPFLRLEFFTATAPCGCLDGNDQMREDLSRWLRVSMMPGPGAWKKELPASSASLPEGCRFIDEDHPVGGFNHEHLFEGIGEYRFEMARDQARTLPSRLSVIAEFNFDTGTAYQRYESLCLAAEIDGGYRLSARLKRLLVVDPDSGRTLSQRAFD